MGRGSGLRLHGRELGARASTPRTSTSCSRSASTRPRAASEECDEGIARLKDARAEFLTKFPSLSAEIVNSVSSSRRSREERESVWCPTAPSSSGSSTRPELSDATRRAYRVDVEEFASWLRKRGRSLEDVDAATLSAYTAELGAARPGRDPSKLAPATIARKLAAVRALLRFALGAGRVPDAQLGPRRSRRLPDAPKSEEVDAVLEQYAGVDPLALRNRALLELVYSAGLRSREAVDLDLGDVDFEQEAVHVRGKGGKERVVPLGEEAAYRLRLLSGRRAPAARQRRRGRALPLRARPAARHEHAPAALPAPAPAAARVRDAPARGRRRPARDPGAARPQLALDDADVQPRGRRSGCARSMTEPTRDPEVEAFLAVSAARLAPRTVEAYRRDLDRADGLPRPQALAGDARGARALRRRAARARAGRDDDRAPASPPSGRSSAIRS